MSYEAEAFTTTFATSDRIEGMKAFLEKRSASFGGKYGRGKTKYIPNFNTEALQGK
jgi:hypothetical protein